jgi:hypothetical protein
MSPFTFLVTLILFFLFLIILGAKIYKTKEISNSKIALFLSGSLGVIHFFTIVALNVFDKKSILFGVMFIILYLVVGYPYGMWLLGRIRKK